MTRYYRKIITISAEDSPNVRYAREQIKRGLTPDNRIIVPGLLSWDEYLARRATWDEVRQCIGLDGKFYKGAQLLLYPPDWLDNAHRQAERVKGKQRGPYGLGCDPSEGGDNCAWAIGDLYGLVEVFSCKTPDTNVIPRETIRLMAKWNVAPTRVCFDRGGGGKQHADRLNAMGYDVRSVGFGQKITLEPRGGKWAPSQRREQKAESYEYYNRRAQMFGELSELMNPVRDTHPIGGWAMPEGIMGAKDDPRSELRHQLAPIPKLYDEEQRLKMLPKNVPTADRDPMNPETDGQTLVGLIGHSPDEADAVVLYIHALLHSDVKRKAGAPGYTLESFMTG